MTEEKRKEIIKKINIEENNNKKLRKKLMAKKEELQELLNDTKIKYYLELVKSIKDLEKNKDSFDRPIDNIITYNFLSSFKEECLHDIWIYDGSYYEDWVDDYYCEHSHIYKCEFKYENHEDFIYNIYYCLGCGKQVHIEDWEEFEETHFVLKNRKDENDFKYYQELYYKLLYEMSCEEAKEKVIDEFNKNKEKNKTRKRTK